MASELAHLLVRLNLSLSAAILIVLILRGPIRRFSGADVAYALWSLVPVIAVGDMIALAVAAMEAGRSGLLFGYTLPPLPAWMGKTWLTGAVVILSLMLAMHVVCLIRLKRGKAGPAVVGMLQPRLYLPLDFTQRYTEGEQRLIRAHERVHMERNDVLANTLMSVLRCLLWFNPLVHLAALAVKHDQELACDAQVMDLWPDQRKPYAAALLKAGLDTSGTCAFGSHPLETRIVAIVRGGPMPHPRITGVALLGLGAMALLGGYAMTLSSGPDILVGPYSLAYIQAYDAQNALVLPAFLRP